MRFVAVKSVERQSALMMHRARDLVVRQRTMLVNALRGHMAEFGFVVARGLHNVAALIEIIRNSKDDSIPEVARQVLIVIADQIVEVGAKISALEAQILTWHKSNQASQRLATIPG